MQSWIWRLLQLIGLDRAVLYTVLNRGWTLVSGTVSLLLLSHFLSPVEQGYYFTFSDILALQILFELGLATVLVPFASHEYAHLQWTEHGILEGDEIAKSRLASLLRFSLIWYGVVALLVLTFFLPGGMIFFTHYHRVGTVVHWQFPWVWIVLVTAGSLAILPLLCILEGCGRIEWIAKIQMEQTIIGTLLFWITLLLHWRLNTAPVTNTIAFLWSGFRVFAKYSRWLFDLLKHPSSKAQVDWKKEILPLHWRVAACLLSSYVMVRLFGPLLFATHGPVVAGEMGMSHAVLSAISGLSLSWVATKSAPFGKLVAQKQFETLDSIFFPALWQSLAVQATGGGLFLCATIALQRFYPQLGMRLLPPLPLLLFVAAAIIYHVVNAEWIYLRAHKQEPLLGIALLAGCLIVLGSFIVVKPFGAVGLMGVYFVVHFVVSFGGGTAIFLKKRALWHRTNLETMCVTERN
jgi:hypothetical protein